MGKRLTPEAEAALQRAIQARDEAEDRGDQAGATDYQDMADRIYRDPRNEARFPI